MKQKVMKQKVMKQKVMKQKVMKQKELAGCLRDVRLVSIRVGAQSRTWSTGGP